MADITRELLSDLSGLIAARLGLHFPEERWPDMERGVRGAGQELGHLNLQSAFRIFLSPAWTRLQTEALARHLGVGETYFLRERRTLAVLEENILPPLLHDRRQSIRRLKIWSAGCSTGEEPYSIAMLLSRMVPDLDQWDITILATDLNARSLQRASEGIYGKWSFRDAPPWLKPGYFAPSKNGCWAVIPAIKKMVTFAPLNLMEDSYLPLLNHAHAVDIIFCRNVLMYFTGEARKSVIQKLFSSLSEGGWLIVSPAETSQTLFSAFATVSFPGATFYRRTPGSSGTARVHGLEARGIAGLCPDFTQASSESPAAGTDPAQLGLSPLPDCVDSETAASLRVDSYEQASMLYQKGQYPAAEKALLSSGTADARVCALLARVYANQGRLDDGLAWSDKAILADKLDARFHHLRATIQQERGFYKDAEASLKMALYLDPQFAIAHFALGHLALAEGRPGESRKHFMNAQTLLSRLHREDLVPESEGMSAGRMRELIRLQMDREAAAGPVTGTLSGPGGRPPLIRAKGRQ